jgi:hypothetical protein
MLHCNTRLNGPWAASDTACAVFEDAGDGGAARGPHKTQRASCVAGRKGGWVCGRGTGQAVQDKIQRPGGAGSMLLMPVGVVDLNSRRVAVAAREQQVRY